jgi:thioredoxin 1
LVVTGRKRKKMLFVVLLLLVCSCAGQFAFAHSKELDDESMADALNSGPLLVSFCVPFTGACKEFVPIWNKLGDEYKGKLTIANVDVMHNPLSKARFSITNFPCVVLIENGEIFRFSLRGPMLVSKPDNVVDLLLSFAKNPHSDAKTIVEKLPSTPFIPQWFKSSSEFVGLDGKKYNGPTF